MDISFIKSAFQASHYPPSDRPEIAFAGRSNVGKSSLLNVLVNRKKMARTSSKPGRTQALNFFSVNHRLYFVDLPGYGFARVPIQVKRSWQKMVETYLKTRSNLKCVVVILDIRREPSQGDLDLLNWLSRYEIPSVIVLTKTDKLSRNQCRAQVKSIHKDLEAVYTGKLFTFSAKTREGREEIWGEIERIFKF